MTYRSAREAWLTRRRDLADRTGRARERAQREQMLRGSLEEIERVAPLPGEDADLVAEVRRLDDADALRAAAAEAAVALTGSDVDDVPNVAALLQAAQRTLSGASDPRLAGRVEDLRGAAAVVADVVADLSDYLDRARRGPGAARPTLLERQAALRGLTRRYGEDVDAVLAWARAARDELVDLDSSEGTLERVASRRRRPRGQGGRRRRGRIEARAVPPRSGCPSSPRPNSSIWRWAGRGCGWLSSGDRPGSMPPMWSPWGASGSFLGPTASIRSKCCSPPARARQNCRSTRGASGGELSRVMLALEVVLAGADPVGTLVFDEVDAGVGGRAATEIGRRLAALATSHQVIVVTHLAQVAAFATRHYVVDADADGIVGGVGGASRRWAGPRGGTRPHAGGHRRIDGPRTCRGTARRRSARPLVRSNPDSGRTAIQGLRYKAESPPSPLGERGPTWHYRLMKLLSRQSHALPGVTGVARVSRTSEALLGRVGHGDIVVIDHIDIDRATADALVSAGVTAVVNASPSMSGPVSQPRARRSCWPGASSWSTTSATRSSAGSSDGSKIRLYDGGIVSGEDADRRRGSSRPLSPSPTS